MKLKHIPNALTLIRFALIAPFLIYLNQKEYVSAFIAFVMAGFTDGLDGWMARYFNWQTFFGSFVDPIADKLLVVSSFISLALLGALPWWLVILVFLRDLSISFGIIAWYYFIARKLDFKPTLLSKFNTTFQLSLVTLCLYQLAFYQLPDWTISLLIGLTATTTCITYVDYMLAWHRNAWPAKETAV